MENLLPSRVILVCGLALTAAQAPRAASGAAFQVEDIVSGSPEHLYIDPEINSEDRLMVFQDENETIWVGELDPQTGLFVSGHGRDRLIDTNAASIPVTRNGPEWGRDGNGWAIYYCKEDAGGVKQIWRAQPPWDAPVVTQLTHKATDLGGNMPTQDASAETTYVALYQRFGETCYGGYMDVRVPDVLHPVPGVIAYQDPFAIAIRPLANATVFIAGSIQSNTVQAAWVDAQSGEFRVLTDDPIGKYDSWAFRAPEIDGEVVLLANLENNAIGIYRSAGTESWEQFTTLTMPPESPHQQVRSAEPLIVGGATWITLEAFDANDDMDTSIWILCWGENPTARIARRVDGGAGVPGRFYRGDPEAFFGDNEIFVYYNLNDFGGVRELHRCRSGVFQQPLVTLALDLAGPGAVQLRAGLTQPGFIYQVQTCANLLSDWQDLGGPFPGDGSFFTTNIGVVSDSQRFFLMRIRQP